MRFSLLFVYVIIVSYHFRGRPLWISIARRWSSPATQAASCSKRRRNLPRAGDDDREFLCAYGVTDHNVYVISNGIFATEGEGTEHALSLVRHVPLGGVNLSRIDAVNAVSREICEGRWSMDEAEAALTRAETLTPERPITHIPPALGAASFCYLSGGALLDSVAAFPHRFPAANLPVRRPKRHSGFMPYIWGSGLVTLLSGLLAACFPALNASWVVIGGIVPMVPGVTFTTSIREFFNGDYLSGVIHCISAMLTAVCIALGVCGGAMPAGLHGRDCAVTGQVLSAFRRAFVCHSLSCAAQKLSRVRRLRAVCLGLLSSCRADWAVSGHDAGRHRADAALAHKLSIAMKMPSTVFIVTGIFPLVPGAGIYHTAYALVSRNMEAFTLRGMQTRLAGAIALGILIGMGFPLNCSSSWAGGRWRSRFRPIGRRIVTALAAVGPTGSQQNRILNSKIKKFSYSFICGKGYSPPSGENNFVYSL